MFGHKSKVQTDNSGVNKKILIIKRKRQKWQKQKPEVRKHTGSNMSDHAETQSTNNRTQDIKGN